MAKSRTRLNDFTLTYLTIREVGMERVVWNKEEVLGNRRDRVAKCEEESRGKFENNNKLPFKIVWNRIEYK